MKTILGVLSAVAVFGLATPAQAQDAPTPSSSAAPASQCELHVWPTYNYIGMNSGLLSGFGLVGAIADMAAHENRVKTVKELMKDYLGPDIQMAELNKIGILSSLKLPADTHIVVEEPTPFNEDVKANPELKAKVKLMNATFKAGKRLSGSSSPCYSELLVNFIFYQKAMMYGSNLLTFFTFRDFADKPVALGKSMGMVKNPLEDFPPKTPDKVEAAQTELRLAFSKDYLEWLAKKKKP